MVRVPHMRRRCPCGCGRTATHSGRGTNGIALMWGCELRVRRWVRDGYTPEMLRYTLGADGYYRKDGVAILTPMQLRQLIDDYRSGKYTAAELMKRYPVDETVLHTTIARLAPARSELP